MTDDAALWFAALSAALAVLYFILRSALKESITSSIRLMADKKLEEIKSDFSARIEGLRHEYQVVQLRTSLSFEHKRKAFSDILSRIVEAKTKWLEDELEPYAGIVGPVPNKQYINLLNAYHRQQLFLDSDCLVAVDLAIGALEASFPIHDGDGMPVSRDCDSAFRRLEYVLPRTAKIFQEKLGLLDSARDKQDLAILGGVLLLNNYHFSDISLPVKGNLKIQQQDWPADIVVRGEKNRPELLSKLEEFDRYLREGNGVFHEAAAKLARYIPILKGSQGG